MRDGGGHHGLARRFRQAVLVQGQGEERGPAGIRQQLVDEARPFRHPRAALFLQLVLIEPDEPLEAPGPDGKIHKADSTGLFVFTRDGHASVQVMERNPPPQTPAGPEQYSHGGYEATFGTYEVDENAHTFTFHVEGALVRTLIGKDLPRSFEFSGKQLIVKSTRPDEHWKLLGSTTRLLLQIV
jgi:hypothetical protein